MGLGGWRAGMEAEERRELIEYFCGLGFHYEAEDGPSDETQLAELKRRCARLGRWRQLTALWAACFCFCSARTPAAARGGGLSAVPRAAPPVLYFLPSKRQRGRWAGERALHWLVLSRMRPAVVVLLLVVGKGGGRAGRAVQSCNSLALEAFCIDRSWCVCAGSGMMLASCRATR